MDDIPQERLADAATARLAAFRAFLLAGGYPALWPAGPENGSMAARTTEDF
jgi:hypothetical protein